MPKSKQNNLDKQLFEALFSDKSLVSNAQVSSSLMSTVKDYLASHIDKDNVLSSVLSILAPGIIWAIFPTWLTVIAGILMNVFHIDLKEIFSKIGSTLSSEISGGKKMSASDVDSTVNQAFSENVPNFDSLKSEGTNTSDALLIRQAKLFKYAMFTKNAGALSVFIKVFPKILSWVFKAVLSAGGFMVAGDVVNHFLGRENAIDGTLENNKPKLNQVSFNPTQTKFKVKSSYQNIQQNSSSAHWIEQENNNKSSIENMVIDFAKEVYSGLDDLDSVIRSTNGFNHVVNEIVFYNRAARGTSLLFIPEEFGSKKSIVDSFIDQVAQKSQ